MIKQTIPKNFVLYRGSNNEAPKSAMYINRAPSFFRNNPPVYFTYGGNGERIARNAYGSVTTYKTTKNLNLLKISNKSVFNGLITNLTTTKEEKYALNKAFRYNGTRIVRFSKTKYDYVIANLVCRLGYEGYIHPKLFKKFQENKTVAGFHQEIVLCNPKKTLIVVNSDMGRTRTSRSPTRTPTGTPTRTPTGTPTRTPKKKLQF